ncbi:energy transducer TonB [Methylobacterium sp. AMS5]|uniref:energy transducer TonB family protein n=1 Tax=Methylobacterium sp. AMS5 TaxID=925818 RepID=UPI00074F88A2|nr:energy transducer TonB [Methylobacterium sp. AMS5]AMB44196.1 cell envelope biogenesis protein TonB [Methylobacterium sp. AMS5]
MIHPPPEAFVRAAERGRTHQESRESSSAVQILGWAAAGLLTLGVHIGLYLLLTRQAETPAAPLEMPAAVMIDMSPEPTVAKSEVDNAAEGPPVPASDEAEPEPVEEAPPPDAEPVIEAPPPVVKPQAVLPPTPPKAVTKPAPKPPEKKTEKKPLEKKKPEKPVLKKDHPSTAARSSGGPRSDQATADRTAASAAGASISQASRASWQNEMRIRIVRAKRFPPGAAGATGVAVVSVSFAGNGSVTGARLIASSGNAALDAEAVAVMYRAAPFPPPPGGQPMTLTVPMNFNRR